MKPRKTERSADQDRAQWRWNAVREWFKQRDESEVRCDCPSRIVAFPGQHRDQKQNRSDVAGHGRNIESDLPVVLQCND
jgi:hypothetical protein